MFRNPLDRKLISALKALRKEGQKSGVAASKFRELRTRVSDTEVGCVLDNAVRKITSPAETEQQGESVIDALRLLRDRGFIEVAAFLFETWKENLGALSFEEVNALAGNAAVIEAWRKSAPVSARELENRVLDEPERIYATAAADWILSHGSPESVAPFVGLLLARTPRPEYLQDWAEAIADALKKDKNGTLLNVMLRVSSENPSNMTTLAEVVRLNPPLLKRTLESLPSVLSKKDAPAASTEFIEQIFSRISESDTDEREFLTVTLARLGTGILLSGRRHKAGDAVLNVIRNIARRMRNQTSNEAVAAHTWVFENLFFSGEKKGGRLQITLDGARDIALTFEKLSQGLNAADVLTAMAQNLGLISIGEKGDSVFYDPLRHQDVDGGMLPGDPGVVETVGWIHGSDVVLRAKIRKGATHV